MNTEETAQDTAITSNDVGNGHSPAEDLLKKTWKQLQASTKAVKMSSYLCTVFEAQAKVYEKAAKEPGEEMRSAYMKRGIALGVLAGQYSVPNLFWNVLTDSHSRLPQTVSSTLDACVIEAADAGGSRASRVGTKDPGQGCKLRCCCTGRAS